MKKLVLLMCLVASVAIATLLVVWRPPFVGAVERRTFAYLAPLFAGPWTVGRLLLVVVEGVLVAYLVVGVHEVGHVVGGVLAGFRFDLYDSVVTG